MQGRKLSCLYGDFIPRVLLKCKKYAIIPTYGGIIPRKKEESTMESLEILKEMDWYTELMERLMQVFTKLLVKLGLKLILPF